jgi:ankyrin repeat protein/L-ascorbate metabolism protein UlaG (beta-lactamase superfamily)
VKKSAFLFLFASVLTMPIGAQQIHDAVRAGDLAKVKALVAENPQVVNEKDARGRTPLHFACHSGNMEIVTFLIAHGADVKAADPDGFTPLHWAAFAGQADAARALIKAGADPNALSAEGVSPLESAFYGRHPEAVDVLLEGGLKVETTGEAGRALLHRAALAGFGSLLDYLIARGADISSKSASGGALLHSAAAGGLTALVGKLIADEADVNSTDDLGQTPLHLAAGAGKRETVDFLIAKGASLKAVCRDGRNLLHSAAAGGLVDLMDRLVKDGFPIDGPDRYGRTPLLKAAESGSDTAAEFLLARGANVMSRDYYGQTPLHEAAFSGNVRLMDILVRHGADVEAVNEEGSTALLYVSQAGRAEAIDWLLERGARLDVRNKWNETSLSWPLVNGFQELVEKLWPRIEALKNRDLLERYPLHRAAYNGQSAAAAFLLGKGVPIDLSDESGRTPFQRAAQGGSVELAEMLLKKGAKVDAADPEGATPLHLAVKKGRTEMVRFLLQKGANLKAKDGNGRTPLELAEEYAYPNIAAILKDAGAERVPESRTMDVASLLSKHLRDGEAIVWSLGHCGFAVKTKSRLLVFDYISGGWPRPEKPSLANGFVDPQEIKDQAVVVFVSHSHGDHFDPVILSWQSTVKNIRYIFGWKAGKGDRAVDMPAPRATKRLEGMDVFTINCEHNDVPEVAYLVKVDGLSIYHSGDYTGPLDSYEDDMAYILKTAGTIDLAFIERFKQAESLKPRVVFPIHAYNREYMYGAFAREAAEKKLPSRVIIPENKGDRLNLLPDKENTPLVSSHILIHALLYGMIATAYLFLTMIAFSPRVWGYADYPDVVKRKVPAQTKKEKTMAWLIGLPWFVFVAGFPIFSTLALKSKLGGRISFPTALLNVLVMFFLATLGDLVLLDWLLVSKITPRFVIIPGSVKEDYKDFSNHFRGHAKAVIPMVIFGLLIAGLVAWL